jgi:tetratricopeptide (TPR) repeat protein
LYLVEYAPHDIGWRLEVNHPLYALAWLGGGELIAMLVEWRQGNFDKQVALLRSGRHVSPAWLAAALAAVLAAPLVIAIGGSRVFIPLDAGIARLHESISEFRSMVSVARSGGLSRYVLAIGLVLPVVATVRKTRDRLLIAFAAACVGASVVLAFLQVRWWLAASGPELCLLLVVVASVTAARSERTRWLAVAVISAIFVEQAVARIRLTRANVATSAVTIADAAQPLYRDVAVAIRATQPTGDVVLLASPNASSGVGYFGGFKSVGTLYWENADGLRAAAAIFSARTDEEARTLMRTRGVTHVAMIGSAEFLAHYLELARPLATRDEVAQTFGYRLMQDDALPRWLRPVPLATRAGATPAELQVRVMQVVPEQSEPEALWNIALARLAAGDTAAAEQNFRSAIALYPTAQRPSMYDAAARLAYKASAHALALRLFRDALAITPTTATTVGIAWILATSPDDRVRDGAAALAMMESLVKQSPNDPAVLDVLAAALAESGRFAEAVSVAGRVVAIQQRAGSSAAAAHARERLDTYRAGRPWRTR